MAKPWRMRGSPAPANVCKPFYTIGGKIKQHAQIARQFKILNGGGLHRQNRLGSQRLANRTASNVADSDWAPPRPSCVLAGTFCIW